MERERKTQRERERGREREKKKKKKKKKKKIKKRKQKQTQSACSRAHSPQPIGQQGQCPSLGMNHHRCGDVASAAICPQAQPVHTVTR